MKVIYASTAALFLASATLAAIPGQSVAQSNRGQLENLLQGAICSFVGERASEEDVRRNAQQEGFRNVERIEFVNRKYDQAGGCGFYRATAERDGRTWLLVANAGDGRITKREAIGQRDDHEQAELDEDQIRQKLRAQGYRDIRDIAYLRRGDDDFYRVIASHGGEVYRLRVSDETGEVLNRSAMDGGRDRNDRDHPNRAEMNQEEISEALNSHGYFRIENLRYVSQRGEDFYAARAWRDNDGLYQLRISDTTGEIENRRRLRAASLREAELNETQIRRILSQQDYDVRELRYLQRGDEDDFYVALARHGRSGYRVRVSDETGQVLGRDEIARRGEDRPVRDLHDRAEMNEDQIRQALERQGYRVIRLRYITQSDGDWYEVHATLEGVRYEMIVDDEDAEVVRRRVIAGSGEEPREYKRDLNDRAEMNEDQIRQALERQGYRAIRLRYITQSNGDWYETHATLDGVRYEMIVDDEDGRVVRRRRIE